MDEELQKLHREHKQAYNLWLAAVTHTERRYFGGMMKRLIKQIDEREALLATSPSPSSARD
jgi:hypothetical protein